MCTLNIRFEKQAEFPVVIIANRDEFYERPSVPPSVVSRNPAIFAPMDLEAGGTWFGVNQWGVAVAVTNVWLIHPGEMKGPAVNATRSRGLLTLDVLRSRDIEQARRCVNKAVKDDVYDFFNLLVADREGSAVFIHTGILREYPLSEGSFAILNTPYSPDEEENVVLPRFTGVEEESDDWLAEVRRILSRHPEICKHGRRFGTRSSQIVALGRPGSPHDDSFAHDRFWYGDGPPCETEFEDLSSQMRSMIRHGSEVKAGVS